MSDNLECIKMLSALNTPSMKGTNKQIKTYIQNRVVTGKHTNWATIAWTHCPGRGDHSFTVSAPSISLVGSPLSIALMTSPLGESPFHHPSWPHLMWAFWRKEALPGGSRGLAAYFFWVHVRVPEDCLPRLNSQTPLTTTKTFSSHRLRAMMFPSLGQSEWL